MEKKSEPVLTRLGVKKNKIQTRAVVKEVEEAKRMSGGEKKPRKSATSIISELRKKAKMKPSEDATNLVRDTFQSAVDAINMVRGQTGIIFHEKMAEHLCLWDRNYPECPERFTEVIKRCRELNLIDRCMALQPRLGTMEEVLLKHTVEQYDLLKSTSGSENEDSLEKLSSNYDAIYIHPTTFELSLLSVGSTIELVDAILDEKVQNGMAIIRPPGHHAMKAEYNGYCFFNNVAIAAQNALQNRNLKRILIVDWDVHHGQGTQQMFYEDPRVVYFSIHRFENGTFWPNLRESDFDFIGDGPGKGFNFNIPLNKTGMTNADYLAIFQQILIPMAVEFQPELVIVSAGYDAALGCPEGEMEITPACYSHLLSPLMSLANGKVAVVLEGGYCLQSLSESAALTLKTLLGDPCPLLLDPLEVPSNEIQETILNCIAVHRPYWKSLQIQKSYSEEELNNQNPQNDLHKVVNTFVDPGPRATKFATRDCYPIQDEKFLTMVKEKLQRLQMATRLSFAKNRVCFAYDDLMRDHKNLHEDHLERPERILRIKQRHDEYELFKRMKAIKSRFATKEELCWTHSEHHVDLMEEVVTKDDREMRDIGDSYNSVYFNKKTFEAAKMAAGCVLQVVDEVLNGDSQSGVCIVRPPGHHAENDLPHGFCIFNNVAVAANYAKKVHGLKRILIVDWDIHHGNGTQHIFENDPSVLYISIHRYDYGNFFPKSKDGDYTVVGDGPGEGFNVNIPWNRRSMGDSEYVMAFQNIVMPIAYEFNPELVLISAGFDAAIGDPLGGYKVSPEAYGHFTHYLSTLANGKLIICLEGGYNVNSIAYSMTMCSKALLGDPLPRLMQGSSFSKNSSAIETIQNVLSVQEKYWKSLKFGRRKLPDFKSDINKLTDKMADMEMSGSAAGGSSSKESDQPDGAEGSSTTRKPVKTLQEFLDENREILEKEEGFAVIPRKTCPHLAHLKPETAPNEINTRAACERCSSTAENWFCLHCYKTFCGRHVSGDMLKHHEESKHELTLSFSDISVWCYKCEAYIDNPVLYKYKNLAHQDKFHEEMPWPYGDDTLVLLDCSTEAGPSGQRDTSAD